MSDINKVKNDLWAAANQLRAASNLKTAEFSTPVLGLIFLRYADFKFTQAKEKFDKAGEKVSSRRRAATDEKVKYHAEGVLYLPEEARFSYLRSLTESDNIGKIINEAMSKIESGNPSLKDVLPKNYLRIEKELLIALLKTFSEMKIGELEGDAFGKIYEYFLGKFAGAEGQRGGEFFTPTSIVRLIVEILKPIQGSVFDPACGSGGMFVQSAEFVKRHKFNPNDKITIYGQEKTEETVKLGKMNLAVHGLEGDIKQGNTFYEDMHNSVGKFNFVMANPPFNVSGIDKDRVKGDPRYSLGIPKVDNANYLWIQDFYTALAEDGRAGFVMPNSASDARQSEQEIRKKIIQSGVVDVMVSVGSNFFHNVTLPCTLWFFDNGNTHGVPIYITAEDGGGTDRTMILADPDNNTRLYYNGTEKFRTTSDGVRVVGVIKNLTDPTSNQHAATKKYVDDRTGGGGISSWVNFNGQGTVSVRGSHNVSSVTDLGVGYYRVNFSTAMSNTDYAIFIYHGNALTAADERSNPYLHAKTTTGVTIYTTNVHGNSGDWDDISVMTLGGT